MEYTITLEPQLDAFLQSQVQAGHYASPNDVILDALRLLAEAEEPDAHLLESLAQADAGDTFDADEVFAELNKELAGLEQSRQP